MHVPVLLHEVIEALSPKNGDVFVDATFGGGSYTRAILNSANCSVIALDKDPEALERATPFSLEFKDKFHFISGSFSDITAHLRALNINAVDGIVADLGMSSYQLDSQERGFSFRYDTFLDMRMSKEGKTASDVLASYSEEDLASIFYVYGDEKKSRHIARRIIEKRKVTPLTTTKQLVDLILCIKKNKKNETHPATQVFQALRILVNNELHELETFLLQSISRLNPGGRFAAVTFHSLEDRIVKRTLRGDLTQGISYFEKIDKAAPTALEIQSNPRSRSARLRFGIRNKCEYIP